MLKEVVVRAQIQLLDGEMERTARELSNLLRNGGSELDIVELAAKVARLGREILTLQWVLGERDFPR